MLPLMDVRACVRACVRAPVRRSGANTVGKLLTTSTPKGSYRQYVLGRRRRCVRRVRGGGGVHRARVLAAYCSSLAITYYSKVPKF